MEYLRTKERKSATATAIAKTEKNCTGRGFGHAIYEHWGCSRRACHCISERGQTAGAGKRLTEATTKRDDMLLLWKISHFIRDCKQVQKSKEH